MTNIFMKVYTKRCIKQIQAVSWMLLPICLYEYPKRRPLLHMPVKEKIK